MKLFDSVEYLEKKIFGHENKMGPVIVTVVHVQNEIFFV